MKEHRRARRQAGRGILILAPVLLLTCFGGVATVQGAGASLHLRQGNRAFEAGDFEEAFEHYTMAEQEDPLSAQAVYYQGTVLYLEGNYHEALEAFQRVTPRDSELSVLATFSQGNSLARIGELEEKVNPSDALEYYWDSIGAYRRTLALDPDFWDAAYNIEVVKHRIRNLLQMMNMLARPDDGASPQRKPQQNRGDTTNTESNQSQEGLADQPLPEEAEPMDETARDILNEENERRAEQNENQRGLSHASRDW